MDSLAYKRMNGERLTSAINCSEASASGYESTKRAIEESKSSAARKKKCSSTVTSSTISAPFHAIDSTNNWAVVDGRNNLQMCGNDIIDDVDNRSMSGLTQLSIDQRESSSSNGSDDRTSMGIIKSFESTKSVVARYPSSAKSLSTNLIASKSNGNKEFSKVVDNVNSINAASLLVDPVSSVSSVEIDVPLYVVNYSKMSGLPQTLPYNDVNRDHSAVVDDDTNNVETGDGSDSDPEYWTMAGLTQVFPEKGQSPSSHRDDDEPFGDNAEDKLEETGENEKEMGLSDLTQIAERKTDSSKEVASNVVATNFQEFFQKTFSFYKCDNLTINFK